MIVAVLAGLLLSVTAVNESTLKLGWDANTEPDIASYMVQISKTKGGPYADAASVSGTTITATVTSLEPGTTYYLVVRSINARGFWSGNSNEVSITMPVGPASDECAPVTGQFAVSIFPTFLLKTGNKGPGSQTRFDYQLASPNSPIVLIVIAANAIPLSLQDGTNMTRSGSQWFDMPPTGSYALTITASNRQGCTKTASFGQLVVP